jgi:coproporphyrinogen III oxidase
MFLTSHNRTSTSFNAIFFDINKQNRSGGLDGIQRRWSGRRDMMHNYNSFKKWWSETNGNKPYLEKERNVSVLRRGINI